MATAMLVTGRHWGLLVTDVEDGFCWRQKLVDRFFHWKIHQQSECATNVFKLSPSIVIRYGSGIQRTRTVYGRSTEISVEYYSELLNQVSKNWEVYDGENIPIIRPFWSITGMFLPFQDFPFLTRDSVTLNTISISHSPRPLAAVVIRNAKSITRASVPLV